MIRNIRLDLNWFILDRGWDTFLQDANLGSLQGLRKIEIITHTNNVKPARSMEKIQRRKARLVRKVWEMMATRPSLTLVVIRNGYIYRRLDARSRLGNLLDRV